MLIATRATTFEQLGKAIDDAFARWDYNNLHEFTLADGTVITPARWWDSKEPRGDCWTAPRPGWVGCGPAGSSPTPFDLGDNWQHLCIVAEQRADTLETLGIMLDKPLPCWGLGRHPRPVRPPLRRRPHAKAPRRAG